MKKYFKRILIIIFVFLFAIIVGLGNIMVYGQEIIEEYNLTEGKNIIQIEGHVYASSLIVENDKVQAVNYFNESLQKNVGFINLYGGIGKDFLLKPNISYEMIVSENITLIIP